MKESEIKELFRLYFKIDKLADKIFDEFEKAGLLSSEIYRPKYERIEFDECDSENLAIRYYEDSYDMNGYDIIKIPFKVIYENKINEYIINRKKEREAFLKRIEQEDIERQLERERAEYERLKAKFG